MAYDLAPVTEAAKGASRISLSGGEAPTAVVIEDAKFLLSAKYQKAGGDLILTGADGQKIVIEGYFNQDNPPDLVAPGGGTITAELVAHLAGPENPGQYAQIGVPAGAAAIGRVERVGGTATVQHANGLVEELQVGDPVMQGDVVETRDGSQLGISFNDGTAFNLGTNARMVLNELVYSSSSSSNSGVFTLVKGSIAFVAGQVAKSGEMKIVTPISTMGIRGTTVNTTITTDAFGNTISVVISLMSDPDGGIGLVSIIDPLTNTILATMNSTDMSALVTQTANLSILAQLTQKTPEMIQQELAVAQILFPIFLSNPVNFTNLPQPQDLQPRAASLGNTNSEVFSDTRTITETISVVITPTPTPGNPAPLPSATLPPTEIVVVIPENLMPLISVDTPPHLVEATTTDPGVSMSTALITKSDFDGVASYDFGALATGGWVNNGNGIFSKVGAYGTATLNVNTNALTYVLDNTKADSLTTGDLVFDNFAIPVVDTDGAHNSAVATFSVEGTNDAPVVSIDTPPHLVEATSSNPGGPTSTAHLTKSDVDGVANYDFGALAAGGWINNGNGTFSKVGSYGTATLNAGANTLIYLLDNSKADPLNNGDLVFDHFTIPVVDNGGAHASATATFTIEGATDPVNTAPVAVGNVYGIALGQTLHVLANGVLGNDTDAEHNPLTAQLQTRTIDGVMTFNADGSFDFRPFFTGATNFTYKAFDGFQTSNTVTVGISIFDGANTFNLAGQSQDATILLGATSSTISAGSVTLTFTGADNKYDNILSGRGNDLIVGRDNGGVLNGAAGNDTIVGGSASDILIGGTGSDRLTGGVGHDYFVFRAGFGPKDTITDFQVVDVGDTVQHDFLDLRGLGFTSIADVLNHTDLGTNALIHVGIDQIELTGVTKAMLEAHALNVIMI